MRLDAGGHRDEKVSHGDVGHSGDEKVSHGDVGLTAETLHSGQPCDNNASAHVLSHAA